MRRRQELDWLMSVQPAFRRSGADWLGESPYMRVKRVNDIASQLQSKQKTT
jgi:hypothetical protein